MNLYEHTIIARQDVSPAQLKQIQEKYSSIGIESKTIATINNTYELNIFAGKNLIYNDNLEILHKIWHRTTTANWI